jgi:glycyl-tRNA synthetase alpha subunit
VSRRTVNPLHKNRREFESLSAHQILKRRYKKVMKYVESELKQYILELINEEKLFKAYQAIANLAQAKIEEMNTELVHVKSDKLVEFHEKYRRLHEIASCPYVTTLEEVNTLLGRNQFIIEAALKDAIK